MTRTKPASKSKSRKAQDAIALLKADHRQVEGWFKEFGKARSTDRKAMLAAQICRALRVHTQIEEEIFYPPFYDATGDKEIHHEAIVEHDGAKALIEQIEAASPDNDFFDAKVTVLSEMIKHHVKEEEQPGGMFSKARKAKLDLKDLGEQLARRKRQLMAEAGVAPGTYGRSRRPAEVSEARH